MNKKIEKLFIHDFGLIDGNKELFKIQKSNPNLDPTYITTCCGRSTQKTKEWLEELWIKYASYAEPKFLEKIRKNSSIFGHSNFHDHSWEMYVGVVLLSKDFSLIPNKGSGPDIQAKWGDSKNLWIECATTNPGDCLIASGLPQSGDIYRSLDPRISRITSSISKKYRKFKEKYEGKIIQNDDFFAIAINGSNTFTLMPERTIQGAVFGRGNDVFIKTPEGSFKNGYYEKREKIKIQKNSGEIELPTDYFCNDLYKEIRAVIYCENHIINSNNYGRKFGEDLYIAFNEYAPNKLSHEKFIIGKAITRDKQGGITRKY